MQNSSALSMVMDQARALIGARREALEFSIAGAMLIQWEFEGGQVSQDDLGCFRDVRIRPLLRAAVEPAPELPPVEIAREKFAHNGVPDPVDALCARAAALAKAEQLSINAEQFRKIYSDLIEHAGPDLPSSPNGWQYDHKMLLELNRIEEEIKSTADRLSDLTASIERFNA